MGRAPTNATEIVITPNTIQAASGTNEVTILYMASTELDNNAWFDAGVESVISMTIGNTVSVPDATVYMLPWLTGEQKTVAPGYRGQFAACGGNSTNNPVTIFPDSCLTTSNSVYTMRSGIVASITANGPSNSSEVVISHSDGTQGHYFDLANVAVTVGTFVCLNSLVGTASRNNSFGIYKPLGVPLRQLYSIDLYFYFAGAASSGYPLGDSSRRIPLPNYVSAYAPGAKGARCTYSALRDACLADEPAAAFKAINPRSCTKAMVTNNTFLIPVTQAPTAAPVVSDPGSRCYDNKDEGYWVASYLGCGDAAKLCCVYVPAYKMQLKMTINVTAEGPSYLKTLALKVAYSMRMTNFKRIVVQIVNPAEALSAISVIFLPTEEQKIATSPAQLYNEKTPSDLVDALLAMRNSDFSNPLKLYFQGLISYGDKAFPKDPVILCPTGNFYDLPRFCPPPAPRTAAPTASPLAGLRVGLYLAMEYSVIVATPASRADFITKFTKDMCLVLGIRIERLTVTDIQPGKTYNTMLLATIVGTNIKFDISECGDCTTELSQYGLMSGPLNGPFGLLAAMNKQTKGSIIGSVDPDSLVTYTTFAFFPPSDKKKDMTVVTICAIAIALVSGISFLFFLYLTYRDCCAEDRRQPSQRERLKLDEMTSSKAAQKRDLEEDEAASRAMLAHKTKTAAIDVDAEPTQKKKGPATRRLAASINFSTKRPSATPSSPTPSSPGSSVNAAMLPSSTATNKKPRSSVGLDFSGTGGKKKSSVAIKN